MANNVITTSFTINFGTTGSGAVLKAEVDDRPSPLGTNGGNTSFVPGDKVGWLLFKTTQGNQAVTVTGMATSLGRISGGEESKKEVKETLQFANVATANLGYPKPPGVAFKSIKWIGRNLGEVIAVDETSIKISSAPPSEEGPYAGVLEVVYDSPCQVYKLEDTLLSGTSSYEALIVITGTSAE